MASPAANIQNITSSMGNNHPSTIRIGRIVKVYPESLSVDVYVNSLASIIQGIPISFSSRGAGYGSYFMPKEGAVCLFVSTDNGMRYILTSGFSGILSDTYGESERLMAGENSVQSAGGSFMRQDRLGNQFLSSSFGNAIITEKCGVNSFFANGFEENIISRKNISGFGFDETLFQNNLLKETELKVLDYIEYYSKININRIYTWDEIVTITDTEITINQSIKDSIIARASSLFVKLNDTETGFRTRMTKYKGQIQDSALTDQELSDLITNIFTEIKSDFGIDKKGVKIVVERGNALNKSIDNINDISSLTALDFDQSTHGNDICLRLKVVDIATDTIKASASIDTDGNCSVKFKTLKIEVETGGYELIEG